MRVDLPYLNGREFGQQVENLLITMAAAKPPTSAECDGVFREEYRQSRNYFLKSGTDEFSYINSRRRTHGLEPHPEGGPISAAAPTLSVDPANAPFIAEFKADGDYFRRSGTSLENYIQSRRITEGLDRLQIGSRAS